MLIRLFLFARDFAIRLLINKQISRIFTADKIHIFFYEQPGRNAITRPFLGQVCLASETIWRRWPTTMAPSWAF
jgi:hypothetical protein